ncbi:RNA-directed DNA polymerase, eukaryota [Tanacetum coccineum]
MRALLRPVSWLGSHTKHVTAATSSLWTIVELHEGKPQQHRDGGGANLRLHSAGLTPASTTNVICSTDRVRSVCVVRCWFECSSEETLRMSANSASCRVQSLLTSDIPVAVGKRTTHAFALFVAVLVAILLFQRDALLIHAVCVPFNFVEMEGWLRARIDRLSNLHRHTPRLIGAVIFYFRYNIDFSTLSFGRKRKTPYGFEMDFETLCVSKKGNLGDRKTFCISSEANGQSRHSKASLNINATHETSVPMCADTPDLKQVHLAAHGLRKTTGILLILSNMEDRWIWDLNGDGGFCVKEVRNLLDVTFLPKTDSPTRWIKTIPIKVNIFAWKVSLDRLPTRSNLARRGVLVPSSSCLICNVSDEEPFV